MSLFRGCLVVIVSLALPVGYPTPRGPLAATGKSEQEGKEQLRKDLYGDPLPPGAVARMGTLRFRQPGCCLHVAYSPDGKLLASGWDEGIAVWDVATGKRVAFFQARDYMPPPTEQTPFPSVASLAFSLDGRYLAAGFRHGRGARVWEVVTGKLSFRLSEWYESLDFVAFTTDGRGVFTGDSHEIRLSEVTTAKELRRWVVPPEGDLSAPSRRGDGFGCKALSPDGKTLAAVTHSPRMALWLWDTATGKECRRLDGVMNRFAFGPDSMTLAVSFTKKAQDQIVLLDVATGKEIRAWNRAREPLHDHDPAFSPDGKTLAADGWLWDVITGKAVRRIVDDHERSVYNVSFAPDGKTLAVGRGNSIAFWEVATGKPLHVLPAHRDRVGRALAYSPDGRLLASGDYHSIRLWDPLTGKPSRCFGRKSHLFYTLAFSPDGRILASAGQHIVLWDPATGKELRELRGNESSVDCIAFAPDGKTLISGAEDFRLWEVATGKELYRFEHLGGRARAVAFSPDGKTVALSGGGGAVWLWDVTTRKLLHTFVAPYWEQHGSPDCCLAFSPNGDTLASVNSHHRVILLWDVGSGKQLRQIEGHVVEGRSFAVFSLKFSPDGRSLASAGRDGTIRVWEVQTGRERFRLSEAADAVAISPDGKMLAASGDGTAALIWDLTGRLRDGNLQPARLRPKEIKALWADLASEDGARIYQAVWALVAAPQQTVPFMMERLQAVPPIDPGRLASLIDDLDSEQFAVRERASEELEKLGDAASPALLHALKDQTKPERCRRAERLLDRPEEPLPPKRLRVLRAIEVLGHIASPEACAVLEKLAKGAPGAAETEHARVALQRLHRLTSN